MAKKQPKKQPKKRPDGKAPRRVKGSVEIVYVDRPWPTPKSLAALRRLLFPEGSHDDEGVPPEGSGGVT